MNPSILREFHHFPRAANVFRRLTAATVSVVIAMAAVPALAVVTADSANIGKHPSYSSAYSAFWRTSADYSLLTDGVNSFLNAPSASGTIYLRAANGTLLSISSSGLNSTIPIISGLPFGVQVSVNDPNSAVGVYATNFSTQLSSGAITGASVQGTGVSGQTTHGYGVYGFANGDGTGVIGSSIDGTGVFAFSNNGLAFFAAGTGNIQIEGSALKPGGGSWSASSDIRIKKNVVDFDQGLAAIERVRPVRFQYNGLGGMKDDGKKYVGVVAQDLEKVLPWMVSSKSGKLHETDLSETDIKQVDPSAFTYLLVNAVKELAIENRKMKEAICNDHPRASFCFSKLKQSARR